MIDLQCCVSDIQQDVSVIHMYLDIFSDSFPLFLLQEIEVFLEL